MAEGKERIELLVGSDEFWGRLRRDISDARHRVVLQTLSFEGDRAGAGLGRALRQSRATDRRLLVDGFTLLYHNDRIIPGPAWMEGRFRDEVFRTHAWVRRLRASGAGVRFGNPVTANPLSLIRRNHKKIAVVDDRIAYLGGINFSDHNFEWHDMMLRVESPELAAHLVDDFDATWHGRPVPSDRRIGSFRVLSTNGRGNASVIEPVLEAIAAARSSIDIVSPYLSPPFTGAVVSARERGVRVRILTPAANNKPPLGHHIREVAHRHELEVTEYAGGMSHMKAMVIDDRVVVAGSLNFDFLGYHLMEELVFITEEPGIRESFRRRIWEPEWHRGERAAGETSLTQRLGHGIVRAWERAARFFARPSAD